MDPEIEELKALVKKNIELSQDTNRIVHSMRRSARWSRFFRVAWWLLVLAVSAAAYYWYLAPYVEQLQQMYETVQAGSTQAQGYQEQFADFIKNFGR